MAAIPSDAERAVCAAICRSGGLRAKEIAKLLDVSTETVDKVLYRSPLLKELCWQDGDYRWHGLVPQTRPHAGLREFAGWYGFAGDFLALSPEEWLAQLKEGCDRVGRSLNDNRGLLHSFRDCRETLVSLFGDLAEMAGEACLGWELAFELRLKRSRRVRLYADVLVITENRVFSLEFKMKDKIDPEEVRQAAKYAPWLEVLFGPEYEIIPVLVLTAARELYTFSPIGEREAVLPVCSGDMLFNAFDEYLGFLR
ncbi:MAG: helix-turn-helix domain containing protein [Oscillospiraceae bacterium]|nr:helix-turn-helix domain containing protein [Oscillospiraceae bacterium]MBR3556884.1 helix-turn-helix domain containing protein [Oscillospiraceae bacterium]